MPERVCYTKASSFLTLVLISLLYTCSRSFTPTDNYLVNCGSSGNTLVGTRLFVGDANLTSKTLSAPKGIIANTTTNSVASFDSPSLYQTARIFTNPSSYSFQIQQQGRHFIRLHFYPFVYQNYDLSTAKFNVSTQDITLLASFDGKNISGPMLKEYLVNITRGSLTLSFVPFSNLAFVNAIEVVSVPDNLILDSAQTINPLSQYNGLSGQAFETVYRVNMGIPKVTPDNDTLWRTWVPDMGFLQNQDLTQWVSTDSKLHFVEGLATQESAPSIVYSTATELASSNTSTVGAKFNMTWQFDLQEGYTYMLRFHFCDIVSKSAGQLIFDVYVGPWAVLTDFELSSLTYNSLATPLFEDFILSAKDSTSKLSISIGPSKIVNVQPDGILNGLEIFKFDGISGTSTIVGHEGSRISLGAVLGIVGAGVILLVVIVVMLGAIRKRRLEKQRSSKIWTPFSVNGLTNSQSLTRSSNATTLTLGGQNGSLGYRFGFSVLLEATNHFDENWVIGVGGFGKVYKGTLRDGTRVAVKRGNTKSHQGINEFRTEIELLSRLRHRHLVSLVGYCDERNEMILVYEYMENGTLKSHLYGSGLPFLTWKQRLEICIGSARGLHYLHTGFAKAIIHRDVKSANILLDENLMAKVADFGLSKTGPELDQTHVSTAVKGSFGYLDPEYFRRQQLTEKSDVYSFGVVLLEVLCARPVIDPTLPKDMVNLAEWAMKYIRKRELIQIVDPKIAASIRPDSLRKFGETAEKCLADNGSERPNMGDVLWHLEYALQLQDVELDESGVNSIKLIAGASHELEPDLVPPPAESLDLDTEEEEDDAKLNDIPDVSMRRVFSQLIKHEGR
ncbi:hypothetical protein LUZ63_007460 [Rhynchospora breviuscula]|uniref:Protein kinase domain-containing protein n=1 Tax=Rhynchospora breviuscula TaxID=2022672 RepID=A0A9Q0CRQ6_9POAL|nr:hypothetical protein LUZ63_007460 [Rhynchospora breviuscula]